MNSRHQHHIIAPDASGIEGVEELVEARVFEVFDGDGFVAGIQVPGPARWHGRVPLRFAFIDAPEMEQPFAGESKTFLESLILGKSLELVLIGKQSTGYMPLDQYRRLLCMGFLTETMEVGRVDYLLNGECGSGLVRTARQVVRNIELEMIINGCAWVLRQYAYERQDEYLAAEEDARRNRRGLWAMDNPEPPWAFKQKQRRRRAAAERRPTLW